MLDKLFIVDAHEDIAYHLSYFYLKVIRRPVFPLPVLRDRPKHLANPYPMHYLTVDFLLCYFRRVFLSQLLPWCQYVEFVSLSQYMVNLQVLCVL